MPVPDLKSKSLVRLPFASTGRHGGGGVEGDQEQGAKCLKLDFKKTKPASRQGRTMVWLAEKVL